MYRKDMYNFKNSRNTNNNSVKTIFFNKNKLILAVFMMIFCMTGGNVWGQRWTGKSSTDWNDTKNWSPEQIPVETSVVTIAANAPQYPLIKSTTSIKIGSLTLEFGTVSAALTVESGTTLEITGDITNNGTLTNKGNLNAKNIIIYNTGNNEGIINNGNIAVSEKITNNHKIINNSGAVLKATDIQNDSSIENSGTLEASKLINPSGTITNKETGNINTTTLENQNIFTNNGSITTVNLNNNSGTFTNNKGKIESTNINNNAGITNSNGGSIKNSGTITNNNGTIENQNGGTINSTTIENKTGASVDNKGNISSDNITNNGNIKNDTATGGKIESNNVQGGGSVEGTQPVKPAPPATGGGAIIVTDNFNTTKYPDKYNKITLEGTNNQTFTPSTDPNYQYPEIVINKTGGSVTFDGTPIDILKFTDTSSGAVNITFSKGGKISGDAVFSTTGTVTINAIDNDFIIGGNFEHKNGNTILTTGETKSVSATSMNLKTAELSGNISGEQTYSDKITLKGKTNINSSSNLTFNEIGGLFALSTSGINTTFTAPLKIQSLATTGAVTLQSTATVTTKENQEYNGKVTISNNTTLTSETNTSYIQLANKLIISSGQILNVNGNLSNTGTGTINNEGRLQVSGNFNDAGTYTGNNGTIELNGTTDQTFTPNIDTTYSSIEINKNNNSSVTFTDGIKLASISNGLYFDGNIIFTKGATITNDTTLTTIGTVTFGNDATDVTTFGTASPYASFTHTTGPTEINSTFTSNSLNAGKTTLSGKAEVTVTTADFGTDNILTISAGTTLNIAEDFTNNGKIINDGALITKKSFTNSTGKTLNSNSGATAATGTLTISGNLSDNGTISCPIILDSSTPQTILKSSSTNVYNISVTGPLAASTTNSVTFNEKITLSELSTTRPIIFKKGAEINKSLTINKGSEVSITTENGVTTIKDFSNNGTFSFTGILTVDSFTNTGTIKCTSGTILKVKDDFKDSGTIPAELTIHLTGEPATPASPDTPSQTFTPNTGTKYGNVIIANSKSCPVIFKNDFKVTNFSDSLQTDTFKGDITFEGSGEITNVTELKTTGKVTIGNNLSTFTIGTPSNYANFTHTAGETEIKGTFNTGALETGTTTFAGTINAASIKSGSTGSAVPTLLETKISGNVETTTSQSYNGPFILTGEATLKTKTPQNITFNDTINGAFNLNIGDVSSKAGSVLFKNSIGPDTAKGIIADLNINADSITLPSYVTTTGIQNYNGIVILQENTILKTPKTINFENTINGNKALTIGDSKSTSEYVTIKDNIGNTNPLTSLEFNSTNINVKASNITTSGAQTYNGIFNIQSSSIELITTNTVGNIDFKKEVKGSGKSLTMTTADNTTINFEEYVTLQSIQDSSNTVAINFKKGGNITNTAGTTLNSKGIITFGTKGENPPSIMQLGASESSPADFTHTAGNTVANGKLFTKDLTLGTTTLNKKAYIKSNSISIQSLKDLTIPRYTTVEITGNFTNEGTIKNDGTLKIGGDYITNANGSYTGTGTVELNGTGDQNFTPKENDSYTTINVTNNGGSSHTVTFKKTLKIKNFSDKVTGTTSNCNITFEQNCNFTNKTTFNTEGTVTFGTTTNKTSNDFGQTGSWKTFIHTNGPTEINGTLTAGSIELGSKNPVKTVTLLGDSTLESKTNGIIINGTVTGAFALTTKAPASQKIDFNNEVKVKTIKDSDTNTEENKADINFGAKVTTSTETNLLTSGNIQISNEFNTTNNAFSHINGTTEITSTGSIVAGTGVVTLGQCTINGTISAASVLLGDGTTAKTITMGTIGGKVPNITTTGTQQYKGELKLNGATELSADDNITFDKAVTGNKTLTITKAKNVTFSGNITGSLTVTNAADVDLKDISADLTITKAANVTFSSDIGNAASIDIKEAAGIKLPLAIATSGIQSYAGPVTLSGNTTLKGTEITFTNLSAIDSPDTSNLYSLTIGAKNSPITSVNFGGIIGSSNHLTSLDVNATTITIPAEVKTSEGQTYNGNVLLAKDTVLNAINGTSKITFNGSINGNHKLTIGNITKAPSSISFKGDIGDTSKLTGLVLTSDSITLPANVLTTGEQSYTGNVTFTDTKLSTNNNVSFTGDITGPSLAIDVSGGNIIVTGKTTLNSLSDTSGNAYNITFTNGGIIKSNTTLLTTGTVTFNDSGNYVTNFTFGDVEKSGIYDFTHTNGKSVIYDTLYAKTIKIGNTEFNGTVNADSFEFYKPILLKGDTKIKANKSITFTENATIDTFYQGSIKDSPVSLIVESETITFNGYIGQNNPVLDFTVNTTTSAKLPANVITAGIQSYKGPVILVRESTLKTETPQNITFNDTINGAFNLNIGDVSSKAGIISFEKEIGTDPVSIPADLNINADSIKLPSSVTTTGIQNYKGPIILTIGTTITTPDIINFESTVKGQQTLKIGDSTGTKPSSVNIKGSIGDKTQPTDTPTSLEINSTDLNLTASNITTSGAQTYNGIFNIQSSSVELTTKNIDGNIDFKKEVKGSGKSLTMTTADNTTINFEEYVTLQSIQDSSNTVAINFKKGGNITNTAGTTLNTKGIVTFGTYGETDTNRSTMTFGTLTPVPKYANFTHTAGKTIINGKLIANKLTLGATTLLNPGCHVKVNSADIGQSTTNILKIPAETTFEITTDFTNTGTIENAGTLIVGGDYNNTSGIYHNGILTGSTYIGEGIVELNGTGEQSFTPNSSDSYHTITVTNQGGNTKTVTFTSHIEITKFNDKKTDTSSGSSTEITASCNITFEKGCTINTTTNFYTTGAVTFGTSGESTASETKIGVAPSFANLTHKTGNTIVYGKLYTTDLTLTSTTITGTINAAKVTFGNTTLKGEINATSSSIGNTSIEGSVNTKNGQLFTGTLKLTGPTTLKSTDSTDGGIEIKGAVSETGNQTLNIQAASGKEIKFVSTVNIGTIKDSDTTTEANKANVNFASGVTTKTDTEFLTSGYITINGIFNTTDKNFEHTSGKTIIETPYGYLNTGKGTVNLGESVIKNKITASSVTLGNTEFENTPYIETTGTQTYSGTVTLTADNTTLKSTSATSAADSSIIFNKAVTGKKLTVETPKQDNTAISFNDTVNLTEIDDSKNQGIINFNKAASITSDVNFETPNNITFADTFTAGTGPDQYKNITHNKATGKTIIKNTCTAKDIILAETEIIDRGNIKADSISLGNNTKPVTFGSNLQEIITTAKSQNYNGPVTVSKPATLTITTNTNKIPVITFNNTISLDKNQLTLSAYTAFKGTKIENLTSGKISSPDYDFVIIPENETTIAAPITAKRIIINNISQTININSNICGTDDLAIYGSAYCTTDQESGIGKIYTYDFNSPALDIEPASKAQSNPPASFAKETVLGSGSQLSASRNIYINGVKITGTGTFDLPANKNTINNKAEAFYSDFANADITINNNGNRKLVTEACKLKEDTQTLDNGWDSYFGIAKAYTIDDNVICIEFDREIRLISENKNGLSQKFGNRISYTANSNNRPYNQIIFKQNGSGFNPLPETSHLSGDASLSKIYLSAYDTWNTDATGISAGTGTDKNGKHITNIIPTIDIKRNSNNPSDEYNYFITDLYGKRLVQYSDNNINNTKKYTENKKIAPDQEAPSYDQCPPVLIAVSDGQELHDTEPSKWQSYDAHNFIEFRYSEAVTFGNNQKLNPDITLPAYSFDNAQNITPALANFGEIKNNSTDGFTIKGIGTVSNGRIVTGTKDNPLDLSINTFYRKDPYSVRISIAGKTTDTPEGKKWDGYIDYDTIQPSGSISGTEKNTVVKDLSLNNLVSVNYKLSGSNLTKEEIQDIPITTPSTLPNGCNTDKQNLYTFGDWDLSSPVFAPVNIPESDEITWGENSENQYEIIGTASAGTKLQRLEFHLFDNTPDLTSSELVWYSSKGWYSNNYQKNSCADIYGGSKPFVPKDRGRTTGGIRYHTINEKAFSYSIEGEGHKNFISVGPKIVSSFFTGLSSTENLTPAGELYFSLELDEKKYPIETTFYISYMPTSETGYITDLAGNKLKTIDKNNQISSIDRTPPAFNILLSPVNQKELFIVFSKKIETNLNKIKFRNQNKDIIELKNYSSFEEALPYSFKIISIDDTGNVQPPSEDMPHIDTSIKAECNNIRKRNHSELTTVKLALDRPVSYSDLKSYYIQLAPTPDANGSLINNSFDTITGIKDARVTIVRDRIGNFMQMYSASPISYFAINLINPLYAHNPEIKNNGTSFGYGLYEDGSWAVHDWSEKQQNYGTLYADERVEIAAHINNDEKDKNALPKGVVMYLDNSPDKESISTQLSEDLDKNYRIWLPQLNPDFIIPSISQENNSNYNTIIATNAVSGKNKDYQKLFFNINKDLAKELGTNQQISFLFAVSDTEVSDINTFKPVMIYNKLFVENPDKYDLTKSTKIPLYCLRLSDQTDISSIDLWSYKTKSITKQRGGVTILNNVINAPKGEDTIVQVSVPSSGNLNVIVTTIDGNIVKYLHRGRIEPGEYNFYWNGRNTNNSVVARGLYFIRVIGTGFDETRKVMVIH